MIGKRKFGPLSGLLILLIVGVLALLAVPMVVSILWVGHQDITFRFLVIDRDTDEPIDGARLVFYDDFARPGMELPKHFIAESESGPDGHASLVKTCKIAGQSSVFGISNTSSPTTRRRISQRRRLAGST